MPGALPGERRELVATPWAARGWETTGEAAEPNVVLARRDGRTHRIAVGATHVSPGDLCERPLYGIDRDAADRLYRGHFGVETRRLSVSETPDGTTLLAASPAEPIHRFLSGKDSTVQTAATEFPRYSNRFRTLSACASSPSASASVVIGSESPSSASRSSRWTVDDRRKVSTESPP